MSGKIFAEHATPSGDGVAFREEADGAVSIWASVFGHTAVVTLPGAEFKALADQITVWSKSP